MRWGIHRRERREERRTTRQRALCALLAAAALAPLPAAAQQAETYAIVQTEILDPLVLVNDADMYFGRIMPGSADGTVVMTPNGSSTTATCTTNNGIVRTDDCRAARFAGSLPFIYNLQITKPPGDQATLTGPAGATMQIHNFTFAKGSGLMLGGSLTNPTYFVIGGNFSVYVGATLDVARTQRAGIYNGSFTLTFNYN